MVCWAATGMYGKKIQDKKKGVQYLPRNYAIDPCELKTQYKMISSMGLMAPGIACSRSGAALGSEYPS